jgi:hypothetical protein
MVLQAGGVVDVRNWVWQIASPSCIGFGVIQTPVWRPTAQPICVKPFIGIEAKSCPLLKILFYVIQS